MTKHSHDLLPFGRKMNGCARCEELKAGAPARSWAKSNDRIRCDAIRAHKCGATCGTVCTYGEW